MAGLSTYWHPTPELWYYLAALAAVLLLLSLIFLRKNEEGPKLEPEGIELVPFRFIWAWFVILWQRGRPLTAILILLLLFVLGGLIFDEFIHAMAPEFAPQSNGS